MAKKTKLTRGTQSRARKPARKLERARWADWPVTALFRIIRIQRHTYQFNEHLIYLFIFFSAVLVNKNEY